MCIEEQETPELLKHKVTSNFNVECYNIVNCNQYDYDFMLILKRQDRKDIVSFYDDCFAMFYMYSLVPIEL
jgi:hypothetical protein